MRKVEQEDWIKWLHQGDFNCAVTLAFNDSGHGHGGQLTFDGMRERCGAWLKRMDNAALKGRHLTARELRIRGLFVAEKIPTNPHLHGILWFPPNLLRDRLRLALVRETANEIWGEKLWDKGTLAIEPIHDRWGWARYVTKESGDWQFQDRLFFAQDFWPQSAH